MNKGLREEKVLESQLMGTPLTPGRDIISTERVESVTPTGGAHLALGIQGGTGTTSLYDCIRFCFSLLFFLLWLAILFFFFSEILFA